MKGRLEKGFPWGATIAGVSALCAGCTATAPPANDPTAMSDPLADLDEATQAAVELALARADRAGLATRYGDEHPDMRATDARILELEGRIVHLTTSGSLPDDAAARERITAARDSAREALAALGTSYGPRHPDVVALRARIDSLNEALGEPPEPPPAAPTGTEPDPDLSGTPAAPRVVSVCDAAVRTPEDSPLLGRTFENAAVALPDGLVMRSESAVGDGPVGLVVATRGDDLVILVDEYMDGESPSCRITHVIELQHPCDGFEVESRTCDVDDAPAPDVFAYMDGLYACGGHGQSTPALAWRLEDGRAVPIDPTNVTCGGESCEVDPPLP